MKTYAEYDFESFVPTPQNPEPNARVMEFITIGPFVLETKGSFEYEHMYAREKLLAEDYLAASGGERNVLPEIGKKEKNEYYGPAYLVWREGIIKWNSLRFDPEGEDCDDALYATEQRNAVYYAGFYVNCDAPKKAVVSYWNSGSTLYLNGEMVDFQPYGRVKGLNSMGYAVPVTFREGRNLLLFKIRPGFIADCVDLSMIYCAIFPVILTAGGISVTAPTKTLAYTGTKEEPRMVFPFFAFSENEASPAVLSAPFGDTEIPALKPGIAKLVRIAVPAGKTPEEKSVLVTLKYQKSAKNATMYFKTQPYDGFDGEGYVFSDFHFDTTYHQEQRTYALGAFHLTKRILENLEANPDFKATLSEIDYLHPYYSLYPKHRKTIKEGFRNKRIDADSFYNQPNDLTSSGEAFVRNLIYGQLYHRDVLGSACTLYAPSDVYGHFSQISQICAKGGVKAMRWKKMMLGVDNLFRHVSPDGTVMLHDKWASRDDAVRLGLKFCTEDGAALSYIEAYPRTGDTEWMKKTVSHAQFAVFSQLADKLLESDKALCEAGEAHRVVDTSRDLTQHHSGTLLTRTDFKEANRLCENLLVSAEKFASVAFIYGAKYPEEALDKAWRQLLTAQHHDSVTGTNNEISFVDLMIEYRECAELASDIVTRSSAYIASLIRADGKDRAVVLFNPTPRDAAGPVVFDLPEAFSGQPILLRDAKGGTHDVTQKDGKGYCYAGTVPAMGYALYRIEKCAGNEVLRGRDTVIENRRFRLEVDPIHGGIISVYDKLEQKEFIDRTAKCSANSVYVLRELHDRMETQHEIYTNGEKLNSDEFEAEITSEKCGSFERLTVKSKLDVVATVIREITLFRDADTVECKTTVEDYQGEDDLFTVAFPVDIKGGQVLFDDRFAPHVSTRSKKYMSFQTHQYASFSGCRILPANRWFGVGPTVTAVLGAHQSIHFGMTAVIRKNTKVLQDAAKTVLVALSKKAVPVTVYPDTKQHGGMKIVHFNEDVYETDTRIVLSLANDPDLYTRELLDRLSDGERAEAEKRAEKDGIAFLYLQDTDNAYRKPVDVLLCIARDEKALSRFTSRFSEELAFGARMDFSGCILTSPCGEAEAFGAELLNRGTIASSVEGKNTLNMMLFHTASFYGNKGRATGGKELVPEQKTHVFTYEFYPHRASYREAGTYEKAERFNTPLFAISCPETKEEAFLPEEKFFLRTSKDFELTAFKAGGYPLAALKKADDSPEKRGLSLRGFETSGVNHPVKIEFGFEVGRAERTDLLEENPTSETVDRNVLCYEAKGYSVDTFRLSAKAHEAKEKPVLGCEREFTEPVFVRSWEHDMGAVSMGNLRFAATIDRKPVMTDRNVAVLCMNLANNTASEDFDVELDLETSEGLKTVVSHLSEHVSAGESKEIPFTVKRDREDREGQVRLTYRFEGRTFTDVYEFGYFNPEVSVEIQGAEILCTVKNPTDQLLKGALYLGSPVETWGSLTMNGTSFGQITPFAFEVTLAPKETKTYAATFRADNENALLKAYYVFAKLCCNGRVHFGHASVHGPRHNVWAQEFINEIKKDEGSIEKLIEM